MEHEDLSRTFSDSAPAEKTPWVSLWGLLAALTFLVGGATLAAFFGERVWVFDVLSSFRVQYLAASIAAAIAFAVGRKKRQAVACAAVAFVNLAAVTPLYLGGDDAPDSSPKLRMLLLNVCTSNPDKAKVIALIEKEAPDVVVLEEVNDAWIAALQPIRDQLPYHIEQAEEDNFGIALYSRHPATDLSVLYLGEIQVASVTARISVDGQTVTLLGTHPLPPARPDYWRWRNDQLDSLVEHIRGIDGAIVLLGDLNATPWSAFFRAFLRGSELKNGRNGFGVLPSWPVFFPVLGIPIDHCLVSNAVTVCGLRTGPDVGSDHRPLIADLTIRK